MSGFALRACIVLAAEAHDGHWLSMEWLAQRVMTTRLVAAQACVELQAAGLLTVNSFDWGLGAGVHVTAESPRCTEPAIR